MKNMKHPIAVLGLPLAAVTLDQAVDRIESLITQEGAHQVATANLDCLMKSIRDPHLHRIIAGCDIVVADGMPLVWASSLLGSGLPQRITAVNIVSRLMKLSASKGYRIFLLGGGPGVAERTRALFESRFPGVEICGAFAPPVSALNHMNHSEIIEKIHAARPDILLVGFGNPKQEKWISHNRKRLGVPVSMGIGVSMEILLGDLKRAPRSFKDFVGFLTRLPLALAANLSQRIYFGPTTTSRTRNSEYLHLHVAGKINAALAPVIDRAVEDCIAETRILCIHLELVTRIDAAGLGILLDARRRLIDAGLTLQTAQLPSRMRSRLDSWCVRPLLDELTPRQTPIASEESAPAMNATKN